MEDILACDHLTKFYKKNRAVHNVNLTFQEKTIYGLVGRNGSGKTTILKMISGQTFQDNGDIYIKGDLLKKGEIHRDICYVKDKNKFLWSSTVAEVLQTASSFHKNWDRNVSKRLVQEFGLNPQAKCRKLSRGMETMLAIIIGIASRSPITIFDEPELGLDSVAREKFYQFLLEDYTEFPRTIILSTHLIDEVAKMLEKVYVVHAGEVILHEDIEELRNKMFSLYGNEEKIASLIEDKTVIYSEKMGSKKSAAVLHHYSSEDMRALQKSDVTVENLTIQQFLTHLLERKKDQ
ncbi:ABC transporter ATP-binding protein [Bacillus paralicheniformis]|uniref:ATP-binding cassette domain-containing protein n=1 Tax=Bacillus paralicheniformis TaxID=1648923 RepID=UPI003D1DB20F